MADGENKGQRLLGIFDRLSRGETISKEALAREYGVTEKSIQRDIDDIRSYLAGDRDEGAADICYDRQAKGYREGNPGYGENPSGKPGLCQRRASYHFG